MMQFLKLHGLWRGRLALGKSSSFGRMYTIFLALWFFVMLVGVVMYLCSYKDEDVYAVAAPLTDLFLILITEISIVLCQTKAFEQQMERYYNDIHLSNYEYHDEVTTQVMHDTEDKCLLLFRLLNWMTRLAPLSYIAIPFIINIASGAFTDHSIPLETTQYILLPFDYKYDIANWIYASIIFAINSITMCYFVLYFIVNMLFIVIHLLGNIEILKHNLRCISNNVTTNIINVTEEEDEEIFEQLKRVVDHHNSVLSSLNFLKRLYGPWLLSGYVYDVVAICILMLVLFQTPISFLRYGSVAVAVILQLVGQSYAIDLLSTSVEEIQDVIYEMPWYAMSRRNKRSIHIMIVVSQRPFVLKFLGTSVNVRAMAGIIKTCFSYFLWLKSMG